MSLIDRGPNRKSIACDQAGCHFQYRESFHPAEIRGYVMRARQEGWTVRKVKGKWKHYCPDHGRKKPPEPRGGTSQGGQGETPKVLETEPASPTGRQWWQDL